MPSFVVEESWNSVRVFWLEQEKLIQEISHKASKIGSENKNISGIILFGSLARGRAVPGSDADLLIILKEDKRPFLERIPEWQEKLSLDFPLEIFPYTEAEMTNPFPSRILEEGIILFKK